MKVTFKVGYWQVSGKSTRGVMEFHDGISHCLHVPKIPTQCKGLKETLVARQRAADKATAATASITSADQV